LDEAIHNTTLPITSSEFDLASLAQAFGDIVVNTDIDAGHVDSTAPRFEERDEIADEIEPHFQDPDAIQQISTTHLPLIQRQTSTSSLKSYMIPRHVRVPY
jgi:hypothetical protein